MERLRFFERIVESCCKVLDDLTEPQKDSYLLNLHGIRLNQLKQEVGSATVKRLEAELSNPEFSRR